MKMDKILLTRTRLWVKQGTGALKRRNIHGFQNTGNTQQAIPTSEKNGTKAKGTGSQQREHPSLPHPPRQIILDHLPLALLTLRCKTA